MLTSYLEKLNLLQIITEDLSTFIRIDSSNPLAFSEENFKILKSGAYIKYSSHGNTYYSFLLHNVLYNVQYKGFKTVEISFYAKEYSDLTLSVFQDIKIQHLGMEELLSGRNLKYYKILKSNGINNFIFDGENLSFKLGK